MSARSFWFLLGLRGFQAMLLDDIRATGRPRRRSSSKTGGTRRTIAEGVDFPRHQLTVSDATRIAERG
jgi:hypothetical protein